MGPVDDGSGTSTPESEPASAQKEPRDPSSTTRPIRRIYQVKEGAMIAGVCNGIALYLGIDPSIVRVLFIVLGFFTLGASPSPILG